jgi:zinc transport system substrate-binding protein
MILMLPRLLRAPLLVGTAALALAIAGCTAEAPEPEVADDAVTVPEESRITVLTAVYPLQYVVEQVGGDLVEITPVAPSGDPHTVELSPRQLRDFSDADVVVYLSGFQPAVDDALAERSPAHVVDAAEVARLVPFVDDHGDECDAHADDEADKHEDGELDPHFWLDPNRLAAVGHQVAEALAAADPARADEFAAGALALEADLLALTEEFLTGLTGCERDTIVTSHAAYGYLTELTGLKQLGVAGVDPEGEPSPARLREVRDLMTELGVTTFFTEPLADPGVADSLSADLGVDVAVLDPVETLVDSATDYRSVMESNLAALRAGLGCS